MPKYIDAVKFQEKANAIYGEANADFDKAQEAYFQAAEKKDNAAKAQHVGEMEKANGQTIAANEIIKWATKNAEEFTPPEPPKKENAS